MSNFAVLDLKRWLAGLALEQYEQTLRAHDIDHEVVSELWRLRGELADSAVDRLPDREAPEVRAAGELLRAL